MNPILTQLAAQCETTYIDQWGRTFVEFDREKFAQSIIKEVLDSPRVYLLYKKDATQPDTHDVLHGWTNILTVAQQWQGTSGPGRSEYRSFENLNRIQRIDSL